MRPWRAGLARWQPDELIRRLARNAGYLLSGNVVAAGLGLLALALMARALGPEQLGLLALVEAYARLVDRLIRLEPWQALIKYGAASLEDDRPDRFRSLLKFGLLVDVTGASTATLIAFGAVFIAGPWLGWSDETVWMAAIYSLVGLTNLAATPTAVLRLFDRFATFAAVEVATAVLRACLVAVAFAAGAGLWTFLILLMGLHAFRQLSLVGIAWQELGRRGYARFLGSPLKGLRVHFPGIWSFVWSLKATNLTRRSTGDLDILIVGTLLDQIAVGLYHVAKRLGEATRKVGMPVEQAIFPEVARLWTRQQVGRLRDTLLRVHLVVGGLVTIGVIIVALNVDHVIAVTVGASYLEAATLVILQLAATTVALYGLGFRAALLSMGLQVALLKIVMVATAGFFVTLFVAIPYLGVAGASLGHLMLNGIWLIGTFAVYRRRIRQKTSNGETVGLVGAGG